MSLCFCLLVYGIHLMLPNVRSFVLLTANFADIKRIAQKFISTPLANEITNFITKLNINKMDASKENEVNYDDVNKISTPKVTKNRDTDNIKVFKNVDTESGESLSAENLDYNDVESKDNVKTRFESKTSKKKEEEEIKNPYLTKERNEYPTNGYTEDLDSTEEVETNKEFKRSESDRKQRNPTKTKDTGADRTISIKFRAVATSGSITLPKLNTKTKFSDDLQRK